MLRKAKQFTKRLVLTKENYEIKKEPVVTMIKVEKVKEERVDDLELLLSMETQTRVDALVEKDSTPKRPTTIKFELPTLPLRATNYPRTTANQPLPEEGLIANERRKKRLSWKNLFKEEEVIAYVTMDARVRLKMRPLPTFGYVKYIGGVGFGKGEWVGIELDHRVGNCDGSMNGQRYFITDHHRGIFCKRNDLEAVV